MAAPSSADASLCDDEETSLKSILAEVGMDEEWLKNLADEGIVAPDAVEILNDASCSIHNFADRARSHGAAELPTHDTKAVSENVFSGNTRRFPNAGSVSLCKTP